MTDGAVFVGERRISASPSPLTGLIATARRSAGRRRAKVASRDRLRPAPLPLQNLCLAVSVSPSRGNRTGAAPRRAVRYRAWPNAQRTPVVPLEAGAGPENPPCPACGEPLFGWLAEQPGLARPGQPLRELRPRRRRRRGERRGGAARARPARRRRAAADRQPRQLRRLARQRRLGRPGAGRPLPLHGRGGAAARRPPRPGRQASRWAPAAGLAATWQTMLNSVTFGHNVALGALGRGQAGTGRASPGSGGSTPWPASSWRSRRWSIARPDRARRRPPAAAPSLLRFELL